jgi:hypothetical protein
MLSVIMLGVIMLSVIMLNVIMLRVVAPIGGEISQLQEHFFPISGHYNNLPL